MFRYEENNASLTKTVPLMLIYDKQIFQYFFVIYVLLLGIFQIVI